MSVIFLLIIISIFIAAGFLVAFYYAIKRDQYEDFDTPARRMLIEDKPLSVRQDFENNHNSNTENNNTNNFKVTNVTRSN